MRHGVHILYVEYVHIRAIWNMSGPAHVCIYICTWICTETFIQELKFRSWFCMYICTKIRVNTCYKHNDVHILYVYYMHIHTIWNTYNKCKIIHTNIGQRLATALLPRLFGMNPRSHHKGATGRVQTGDQLLPVLCHCQLGQYTYIYKDTKICTIIYIEYIWFLCKIIHTNIHTFIRTQQYRQLYVQNTYDLESKVNMCIYIHEKNCWWWNLLVFIDKFIFMKSDSCLQIW